MRAAGPPAPAGPTRWSVRAEGAARPEPAGPGVGLYGRKGLLDRSGLVPRVRLRRLDRRQRCCDRGGRYRNGCGLRRNRLAPPVWIGGSAVQRCVTLLLEETGGGDGKSRHGRRWHRGGCGKRLLRGQRGRVCGCNRLIGGLVRLNGLGGRRCECGLLGRRGSSRRGVCLSLRLSLCLRCLGSLSVGLLLCRLLLCGLLCSLLLCSLSGESRFGGLHGFGRGIAQRASRRQGRIRRRGNRCNRLGDLDGRYRGNGRYLGRDGLLCGLGIGGAGRNVLGPALTTPPAKLARIVRIRVPSGVAEPPLPEAEVSDTRNRLRDFKRALTNQEPVGGEGLGIPPTTLLPGLRASTAAGRRLHETWHERLGASGSCCSRPSREPARQSSRFHVRELR